MKAAILFVLSLTIFMLTHFQQGITKNLYAASSQSKQNISQIRHASLKSGHSLSFRNRVSKNTIQEDYIGAEDDDEHFSNAKHVLHLKYVTLPSHISLGLKYYNYPKNRLPFCEHFSYTSSPIYIFQRVLRI